jgi:PAS domain S-box-containing protein
MAVLLCVLSLGGLADAARAETAGGRHLLFLGNRNIEPVVFLDGAEPAGVAVDIVRAMARHMDTPVDIVATDWTEAQARVTWGQADALIQINRNPVRERLYDFSEPLLESRFSIFTNASTLGLSGMTSLRGLRVGVEAGGLPQKTLESDPRISLVAIPNFLDGFAQLQRHEIDALVVDYRVGAFVIAKNHITGIKVSGEPVATSYSAIAVRKGNAHLLAQINAALTAIKSDGTYQRILDKWAPSEVVFETKEQIAQRNQQMIILGLGGLFAVLFIWMLTLRSELVRRRAAEAGLAQEHAILRGIIDSTDTAIFSVDRQYRYTSFNATHAAMMETLYGAAIQRGGCALDYITAADERDITKRTLERALDGERTVDERCSGNELRGKRYFQVSSSPIRAGQMVIGVAVLAQDITARKQAEHQLQETVHTLSRANAELERFAYVTSHDLQEPVRTVVSFAQMLQRHLGGSLDDTGKEFLGFIITGARRMGELIHDLLAYTRIGRQPPALAPVALDGVAGQAYDNLRGLIAERGAVIEAAPLPHVNGDRAMLVELFQNLISNAIKFTPAGQTPRIEISARQDDGGWQVTVRDHGIGIAPAYHQRIFEIFQRLHAGNAYPGTGIGLALCKGIIDQHGGRLWVESEEGQGAAFHFTLAAAPVS